WRTADKPAGVPKTMGEVREEVLAAWKTYEATRSMEAKIKALTAALRQAEVEDRNFDAALAGAAAEVGRQPTTLPEVAPMARAVEYRGDEERKMAFTKYVPFELPRNLVEFPRRDTRDHLLAMIDLKEPISTAKDKDRYEEPVVQWLDELNKDLFENR